MEKWLKFYDKPAPLICLSEFVSHDPVSDLIDYKNLEIVFSIDLSPTYKFLNMRLK